jgi:hypothetical protein
LARTAAATPTSKKKEMPSNTIIMQPEPPDGVELLELESDVGECPEDEPDEVRDLEEELNDEELEPASSW